MRCALPKREEGRFSGAKPRTRLFLRPAQRVSGDENGSTERIGMGRKAAIITCAIAASLLSAASFAGAFFWHMDDGGNDACSSGAGDAITAAVASAAGDAAYDAGINAISSLAPMKSDSGNPFEYDVDGTTCWVIPGSASAGKAPAGTPLRIVSHAGAPEHPEEWTLTVKSPSDSGEWEVSARDVLVNMPDLSDDIVYDVTYSYDTQLRMHGLSVPNVTGERLDGYAEGVEPNYRWRDDRFIVPVHWSAAWRLQDASDAALEDGYRLVVYDAYRPYRASEQLASAVADFVAAEGMTFGNQWSSGWFVASGVSSHNTGCALDVFLIPSECDYVAEVDGEEIAYADDGIQWYSSPEWSWQRADYPTNIDECSEWSTYSDAPGSDEPSEKVAASEYAMKLHEVMVAAGFSQLESEWWHYDLDYADEYVMECTGGAGLDFAMDGVVSTAR